MSVTKRYRIVVEDTVTELRAKVFEASSLEAAKAQAEADDWRKDNGWTVWSGNSECAIRDDQCGLDVEEKAFEADSDD